MMRFLASITFVLLLSLSALAQDAMPTKQETVNYINKRLQEMVNKEYETGSGGGWTSVRFKIETLSFTLKGDNVEFVRVASQKDLAGNSTQKSVFNPRYIDAVEILPKKHNDQTDGLIMLRFKSDLVTFEWHFSDLPGRGTKEEQAFVAIPFDPKIPDQGARLVKALLHLRDLAKAEDDPFAN